MHLKKLELYGFKSFADKVEIEFDKGITGVVGPNGSGKSNIGDAMRWVLGESSARSLRGAKMEDIIFNGAQKRNALGWCEVSLVFDNVDGVLPVEYEEVAVSRRVYRNGEGEYFINRASCRRKDIVDLFRDTGIGREGYSIIGQGRIADMISHKPEERRDVFHEAAGIMKYRARRDESQRRLDSTRTNIQRLSDIMEEMERQLGPLKRQSKNARRYIEVSEQLKELEVNLFLKDYEKLHAEIQAAEQEIEQINQMASQETGANDSNADKAREIAESIDENEAELESIRNEIDTLNERLNFFSGQQLVMKERLTYAQMEQQRLLEEIEEDESRIQELERESADLSEALEGKGEGSQNISQDIEDIKSRIADIDKETKSRQADIDAKKSEMMNGLQMMADIGSSSGRLQAMIESYSSRMDEMNENLSAAMRQKEINDDVGGELDAAVAKLMHEIESLQVKTEHHTKQRDEMRIRRKNLEADLQAKRDKARNIETRIQLIDSLVKDYEGFSNTVRFLLNHGRAQSLVEGVVADIVDVPKEYATAVERALGGAMQHIVTESDYEAKELISILRQNNAGRATFLPISAIRGRYLNDREQDLLSKQGCLGVAAELISYDDKYNGIVYSLLGRTIICDDIDTATELAKSVRYSCRFVTLKGDMVNPGGSMSGGSRGARESSLIGRRSQLDELNQLFVNVKKNAETAERDLVSHDEKMNEQREAMEGDITLLNEARVAYAREAERLEKFKSAQTENDAKIAELNAQLERIKQNIADAENEIATVETRSQDAKFKETVSREEIAKAQAHVNRLLEDRDEMQNHLDSLMLLSAADEKERAKAEERISWIVREVQRVRQQILQKKDQHKKNEEESEKSKEDLEATNQTTGDGRAQMDALNAKLKDKHAWLERERKNLKSVQELLSVSQKRQIELSDKKHSLEMKHERSTLELERIQNRIWDFYELTYQGTLEFKNPELDLSDAQEEAEKMRRQIRAMGTVNVNAVSEFAELNERYTEHKTQHDDLAEAEEDLLKVIKDLNKQMREKFLSEFEILNEYFTQSFTALFGGGRAQLSLSDEEDVLNSGIVIEAQPPGKKLQMLSLLSGGEKALTAAAILFAMLRHKPSPFCLLDEIETALDEANLHHFADFLKKYSKDTQFVVITHRRPTMESCDVLYGVTMQEKGVSKMISVKLADYT